MTPQSIINHFQATRHNYTSGFACDYAVSDFRYWLAQQNISSKGAVRVWLATDAPPLNHRQGEPAGEFKVFTQNAMKFNECLWVPVPMEEQVLVRWCAAHKVAPITLVDMGDVLVDLSIDQFNGDPSHLVAFQ
jgi:hypothetical protein